MSRSGRTASARTAATTADARRARSKKNDRPDIMIWVAVDALGGDYAPRHTVDGALAAVRHFDLGVALVGPAATLDAELARHPDVDRGRVRTVDAPDLIAMEESPARALRRKPGATI